MLYRTPFAASAAAALLLTSGLAGCGSYTQAGTVTHTAALNTSGGRDTARSGVQSAILVANNTNGIALPGGPTPASIARRVFGMLQRGRGVLAAGGSTGACNNGVKSSVATFVDGSQTTTTDYYFDAACATLATAATPGNTTGSGTITGFSSGGAVRVVEKLVLTDVTVTAEGTLITMTLTASSTATGAVTSGLGATCQGTPPSQTMQCTVAHYGTSAGTVSAGTVSGEAISIAATAGTGGANATAAIGISFYAGTGLGVTQVSGSSTWTVSGATTFNGATGTFTFASAGPTGSGTLTLKDSLYTYTETATLTSTGLSVTIVENPNGIVTVDTPIATATIDQGGTGVLNYADGTSEPISGGLIGY